MDGAVDATASDSAAVDAGGPIDAGGPVDAGGTDASCLHADADGDGHASIGCGGDDCNDADPNAFPGNPEVCDSTGHDEDCNPATLGPDRDSDGFVSTSCCDTQPTGTLLCGTDCDDMRAGVNPTATEVCDGIDNNCNGMIDEGVTTTFYRDLDGDHYGDPTMTMTGCSAPVGYVLVSGDCNDHDAAISPAATELCDHIDNNCDGVTDEGCACVSPATQMCGASDSSGFLMTGPCHPGTSTCMTGTWGACVGDVLPMTEVCNGIDDNCNGTVDEGLTMTCYADADGDGYAATGAAVTMACTCPAGSTTTRAPTDMSNTDCDDTMASVHPGATEVCNMRDDNCNGTVDEPPGAPHVCFLDADLDGYAPLGALPMPMCVLMCPAGTTGTVPTDGSNTDCDDSIPSVHPGATEVCNMRDDNCDGNVDEGSAAPSTCYTDSDGDRYTGSGSMSVCGACPSGTTSSPLGSDCADNDANANPADTAYFTTPRAGAGGYDYNCNGPEEREYTTVTNMGTCAYTCIVGSCSCHPGGATPFTPGWASVVPGCGNTGSYYSRCAGTSVATCMEMLDPTITRQPCR